MAKRFPDGSYNPTWPWDEDEPAAHLVIGGGGFGGIAFSLAGIKLRAEPDGFVAEYTDPDLGLSWWGASNSSIGAILALLADRCGLDGEDSTLDAPRGARRGSEARYKRTPRRFDPAGRCCVCGPYRRDVIDGQGS